MITDTDIRLQMRALGIILAEDLLAYGDPFRYRDVRPRKAKPVNVCLYGPCDNVTNHNKGYCSASCFKKAKSRRDTK